jgi:hypothetical protein
MSEQAQAEETDVKFTTAAEIAAYDLELLNDEIGFIIIKITNVLKTPPPHITWHKYTYYDHNFNLRVNDCGSYRFTCVKTCNNQPYVQCVCEKNEYSNNAVIKHFEQLGLTATISNDPTSKTSNVTLYVHFPQK